MRRLQEIVNHPETVLPRLPVDVFWYYAQHGFNQLLMEDQTVASEGNLNRTRKDVEQRLLQKAAQNTEFRNLLLENPNAALSQEIGIDIPANVKVTVLEESPGQFYIVLPPKTAPSSEQGSITGVVRLLGEVAGPQY